MKVGQRIADLRGRRTQRAIAKLAQIDSGTLSRIERGQIDPQVGTLEKVADALGVSMNALFVEDSAMPPFPVSGRESPGLSAAQVAEVQRAIDELAARVRSLEALALGTKAAQKARPGKGKAL